MKHNLESRLLGEMDMNLSKLWEVVKDREVWRAEIPRGHKVSDMPEQLNWTELYWGECNCVVVWAFFGIAFLVIGMQTDFFQACDHCWVF